MPDPINQTFENAAHVNQSRLASELGNEFDYIVCGSGSSGSVVAGRLAANPHVSVLLIEAGGSDETDMVLDTDRWPMDLGGELDWSFLTQPNPRLNGRSILYSMGRVLGGGSSINVGTWSRGHKADWDMYAAEAGDQKWGYNAVIELYRSRVEDWTGIPDPDFYGVGGAMHVQPVEDPDSFSLAMLDAAESIGVKRFPNVAFWKTNPALDAPNFYTYAIGIPYLTPENAARYPLPPAAWTLFTGMRPASRGSIHLTGAAASDPPQIETNYLAEPSDLEDLKLGVQRARDIGNAAALRPYTKREHAPASLTGVSLEEYIRNGLVTFWHQSGTAKMGRDAMSVVDGELKVYGVEGLRIADASILPRVTTGNTMAPCIIVGERAAGLLHREHGTDSANSESLLLQTTK